MDATAAQHLARGFDVETADRVADPARTRVQHHPNTVFFIKADFDEVIAAAKRTQMNEGILLHEARMTRAQFRKPLFERPPARSYGRGNAAGLISPSAVRALTSMRHRPLDTRADIGQAVREIAGRERRAHGHHAATDVDSDGGRNDGAVGQDHRTHGRALAPVHVGHHRDMVVNERKRRNVEKLPLRTLLHGNAFGPREDGHIARFDTIKHLQSSGAFGDTRPPLHLLVPGQMKNPSGALGAQEGSDGRRTWQFRFKRNLSRELRAHRLAADSCVAFSRCVL